MKKENDEISELFRNRLSHAEMDVREDFWQELSSDIHVCQRHRRLMFFRVAAAASVLFVLAASSAAFWIFSPKEEIEEAFTQVAVVSGNSNSLDGDVVKQEFVSIHAEPVLKRPVSRPVRAMASYSDSNNDSVCVSVAVSMSFSFSTTHRVERDNQILSGESLWQAGTNDSPAVVAEEESASVLACATKPKTWAVKAAIGTALPADNGRYKMPVTASVTVEKKINKHLAVETGLMYSNLRAEQNLHYLGIPVKMNVTLLETPKLDVYASVGGIADKCIAGASNNGFGQEPVQLALTASVGINYKINDRVALFAEPGVSHHFKTDSRLETLRTARPTNFDLICGLRMTY